MLEDAVANVRSSHPLDSMERASVENIVVPLYQAVVQVMASLVFNRLLNCASAIGVVSQMPISTGKRMAVLEERYCDYLNLDESLSDLVPRGAGAVSGLSQSSWRYIIPDVSRAWCPGPERGAANVDTGASRERYHVAGKLTCW